MTEIVTKIPRSDTLRPLPDLPPEVIITSESLPISNWPHAAPNCPNAWSPSLESPCPSCHCFVCDVPLTLCEDISNHITADGALAEWRRAKRRRNKLAQAWNDIPALVNLIVTLSIDESSKTPDSYPVVHSSVSSTCMPITKSLSPKNKANIPKTATTAKSPTKLEDTDDPPNTSISAKTFTCTGHKSNIHPTFVDKVITSIKPEPV